MIASRYLGVGEGGGAMQWGGWSGFLVFGEGV